MPPDNAHIPPDHIITPPHTPPDNARCPLTRPRPSKPLANRPIKPLANRPIPENSHASKLDFRASKLDFPPRGHGTICEGFGKLNPLQNVPLPLKPLANRPIAS